MKITVRVRSEAAQRALRESRRELRSDVVDIAEEHGRRRVLPTAKRIAPSIVSPTLTIRRTKTRVTLGTTARGMKRRMVGVLNYGGTIRGEIRPKKKKALRLADGRFVAVVRGPRTIKAMAFLERSRDRELAHYRRDLERDLPRRIQRRLNGITT
jgi:hypothetical protein